ncbi:MFS transporter [Pseudomaricurvus alkylphenolicus]|uniref:MFS transporter n=1 Tax=Pseudomaricurvus alkylphenolicus TaxID=1306991 RepID=UPI00141DBDF6|nr:MFS transporter [Pseudomaricurvus alkylphenolicus]NIB38583.1 MFS transporter [Pseudomaricurvus alkylphenolicus]
MPIKNKYAVEAIVFSSYVLFAMAWVGATANMNAIMEAMQVTTLAAASLLSGAVTLAKILGTFIAAAVAIKLGVKRAFLVSGAMVAVGALSPFAPDYDLLLVSRFVVGLGGALMIVYFNPIVLRWFEPQQRPLINGLNAVAFNLGTALVLWLSADLNELLGGWQKTLLTLSLLSLLLTLLWALVDYPAESSAQGGAQSHGHYGYLAGLKDGFNWRYALTYSGVLSFYICLFTFYHQAGINQGSLVMWAGIAGTLAGMIYSKKVPQRVPVIRWSGLVMVATVAGLSFSSVELVRDLCALVLGFVIFFPVTALLTLPHELPNMNAARITTVFSLFYSISYLISTVILWLFGWLVDFYGSYQPAFMMITVFSASSFLGSFFLPETALPSNDSSATEMSLTAKS